MDFEAIEPGQRRLRTVVSRKFSWVVEVDHRRQWQQMRGEQRIRNRDEEVLITSVVRHLLNVSDATH